MPCSTPWGNGRQYQSCFGNPPLPSLPPSSEPRHGDRSKGASAFWGQHSLPWHPRALTTAAALPQIYSPTRTPSWFTTPDAAKWLSVRKGCALAFNSENIRKAFPMIRDAVSAVCDHLATLEGQPGGLEVDMDNAALRVALDVIGLTAFGRDFQARSYGQCEVLKVGFAVE
jgi:hypothetical protein